MRRKWLIIGSGVLLGISAAVFVFGVGKKLSQGSDIDIPLITKRIHPFPKAPFAQKEAQYQNIASKRLFATKFTAPRMKLPDLRRILTYYGPSGRPDAKDGLEIHFALSNNKDQASIVPGDRLYLYFDRKQSPPRYVFSPENDPTSLWLESTVEDKNVLVKVFLEDEKGDIIQEPSTNTGFTLAQKEYTRFKRGDVWNIGDFRVDGTLLARQKARWYGQDLFFQRHGGNEYEALGKKQRIDFADGEEAYSIYVDVNNVLVWDQGKWNAANPGPATIGRPIMQLKKLSDRLMTFDLWNDDGSNRLVLNLLKSNDRWTPSQLQQNFKFVAARTRSQYVFEVAGSRMILSPQDWLVKTDDGWEKLDTIEEIDDYVDRKLQGPMFVFNGIVKQDDKQILTGTLYNASRTAVDTIEMEVGQTATIVKIPKKGNIKQFVKTQLNKNKE